MRETSPKIYAVAAPFVATKATLPALGGDIVFVLLLDERAHRGELPRCASPHTPARLSLSAQGPAPGGWYFAGVSHTALGYGDVVLQKPWRSLGPLCAMNRLLTFGCSTAALFLVLEMVWHHRL